MADPTKPKQKFLGALLAQDQSLSSPEYQEYRAMLERNLVAAERKLVNNRRITIGMWIATGVLMLAVFSYPVFHPLPRPDGGQYDAPFDKLWENTSEVLALVANVLLFATVLRTFLYLVFERRVPEQVRNESRDAVLMELSRKVDAIAQRLDLGMGPEKSAI
jgi:hypothetical protein